MSHGSPTEVAVLNTTPHFVHFESSALLLRFLTSFLIGFQKGGWENGKGFPSSPWKGTMVHGG
ncbi:MAG: hypothetical protein CMA15_03855 [Euryarchaeota archaeon]|nr:hypothetical protein [Euryarchaeota archaeon]